ncbi:hypothetical protein, partial [Microbacterium lacticum]|uniref:hypothetical protein n=2 Tax=Microbacteriaceae TaxID=85023 RepID=UPI0028D2B7EF
MKPVTVAVLGGLAVVLYAAVAALQILVWNPLAAVPGASLVEISGHLDDTGEAFSPWSVLATLLVGPVLALALVVIAALGRLSAVWCGAAVCAVIAAGALGYFGAAFIPGMSLADAYGISGGDHAPGGLVLCAVSAVAAAGAIVFAVVAARRGARGAG